MKSAVKLTNIEVAWKAVTLADNDSSYIDKKTKGIK